MNFGMAATAAMLPALLVQVVVHVTPPLRVTPGVSFVPDAGGGDVDSEAPFISEFLLAEQEKLRRTRQSPMMQRALQHLVDSGLDMALTTNDADSTEAYVLVLVAGSEDGLGVANMLAARIAAQQETPDAPLRGHTITQDVVFAELTKSKVGSSLAAHRVALSDVVAAVLKETPNAIVVLDNSIFSIGGALRAFHTCWDTRGKLMTPKFDRVDCTKGVFVVVIQDDTDGLSEGAHGNPTEPCDSEVCPAYDEANDAANEWLMSNFLLEGDQGEREKEAIRRRISDVVYIP